MEGGPCPAGRSRSGDATPLEGRKSETQSNTSLEGYNIFLQPYLNKGHIRVPVALTIPGRQPGANLHIASLN